MKRAYTTMGSVVTGMLAKRVDGRTETEHLIGECAREVVCGQWLKNKTRTALFIKDEGLFQWLSMTRVVVPQNDFHRLGFPSMPVMVNFPSGPGRDSILLGVMRRDDLAALAASRGLELEVHPRSEPIISKVNICVTRRTANLFLGTVGDIMALIPTDGDMIQRCERAAIALGVYLNCFKDALSEDFDRVVKNPNHYKGMRNLMVDSAEGILDRGHWGSKSPHFRSGHMRTYPDDPEAWPNAHGKTIFIEDMMVGGKVKMVEDVILKEAV